MADEPEGGDGIKDTLDALARLRDEFESLPPEATVERMCVANRALMLWWSKALFSLDWALECLSDFTGSNNVTALTAQQRRARIIYLMEIPELALPPHLRSEYWQAVCLPPALHTELVSALDALNLGEVRPLLAPEGTGMHGRPYTLAMHRWRAVTRVHYLVGTGFKRSIAEEQVAAAFGVSPHTLRSWETRSLPEVLGADQLKKDVALARRAGELARLLERDPDYASISAGRTETVDAHEQHCHHRHRDKPLAELGREYRAALKEGQE